MLCLVLGFQSPSLRGSGRFSYDARPARPARRVSIPFIAGQWSLPAKRAQERAKKEMFQSPSLRGSGRFALAAVRLSLAWQGFNPLHCGAVVASKKEK